MHADLHCHTHYSDGAHSPRDLLERALENNVTHLAITDHDCTDAVTESRRLASELSPALSIVPGVEISCDWQGRELHVVGLGIETGAPALKSLLETHQARRRDRVESMNRILEQAGTSGLSRFIEELPCISVTRSHVATYLVEKGLCRNRRKAFHSWLRKGKKLYVPITWQGLGDAVAAISAAGGLAVLAHPGRYGLTKTRLGRLLQDFSEAGGHGIETHYAQEDPLTCAQLATLADEHQLFQSVGSDFHDAALPYKTAPGQYTRFFNGTKKNAIWDHPGWHLE